MKKQDFVNNVLVSLKDQTTSFSVLVKTGLLLLSTPQKMVVCEINRGVVTIKAVSGGVLTVKTVDYNTGFKDNAVVLTTESIIKLLDKNESEVF